MKNMRNRLTAIFRFYRDGFKEMTWGRVLWALILIKLFVLFGVLRLFFFRPYLQGTEEAKQQAVGLELVRRAAP
jgi:hypothetical protein